MDEHAGRREGRPEGQGERSGPPDPTRKLLKVFGVKVTDYEVKTDELIARWAAAAPAERSEIAREATELSTDLTRWLHEMQTHVLERLERVQATLR